MRWSYRSYPGKEEAFAVRAAFFARNNGNPCRVFRAADGTVKLAVPAQVKAQLLAAEVDEAQQETCTIASVRDAW